MPVYPVADLSRSTGTLLHVCCRLSNHVFVMRIVLPRDDGHAVALRLWRVSHVLP